MLEHGFAEKKKIQNPPDLPVILKRVAAGGETVISPV